jgi:hypothetical protein
LVLRTAGVDMVGSLPDSCPGLGRSTPEGNRLAKGNEKVNGTGGRQKGKKS